MIMGDGKQKGCRWGKALTAAFPVTGRMAEEGIGMDCVV